MSLMFSTTTSHLVYRACGIRLAGISQYLRANQALIRTRNFDGRRRPSAFIPRRIHRDSIELDDVSAVSQSTTRHSQVWDAVVSSFSATGSSKVARQKSSTAYSGQSLCIKLRTGYTGFATRSCQSSMAFHRRNAWRFVAIYRSEALYSNRTHTFIGSLGLYRTQRLVTSSRRS